MIILTTLHKLYFFYKCTAGNYICNFMCEFVHMELNDSCAYEVYTNNWAGVILHCVPLFGNTIVMLEFSPLTFHHLSVFL